MIIQIEPAWEKVSLIVGTDTAKTTITLDEEEALFISNQLRLYFSKEGN